jgi:hypothetical protein
MKNNAILSCFGAEPYWPPMKLDFFKQKTKSCNCDLPISRRRPINQLHRLDQNWIQASSYPPQPVLLGDS